MLEGLGVKRITIDLPFRLNHVHCFLAEGEKGWTILDTGLHNDASIKAWSPHIKDKEISTIILTHYHPDHMGHAGRLQALTGAKVWMTEIDQKLSHVLWSENSTDQLIKFYEECGVSTEIMSKLVNRKLLIYPLPDYSGFVEEGDIIQFGKLDYEVIFTPGHTDGLFCLYNRSNRVLFSTDHILPKITPNISLKIAGNRNPLAAYFKSLSKIKQLDVDIAIPSHGEPFTNVKERIETLEAHHTERLEFLFDVLSTPKTAVQVCRELFRRDLTIHEMRFAIGETVAHLAYLYDVKKCWKEKLNGIWYYSQA